MSKILISLLLFYYSTILEGVPRSSLVWKFLKGRVIPRSFQMHPTHARITSQDITILFVKQIALL